MRKHGIMILVAVVAVVLTTGCFDGPAEHHHSSSSDGCCYTPTEVDTWHTVLGPLQSTIGDSCPCDTGCGGYTKEEGYTDTITLDSNDSNIIDMQFNYTIENWGNFTTHTYVDVCDEFDSNCKTVFEGDLGPGEHYSANDYAPALDNILNDYLYCTSGGVSEDVHVYLGEQDVCTPVSLDYEYDGLYAEYH